MTISTVIIIVITVIKIMTEITVTINCQTFKALAGVNAAKHETRRRQKLSQFDRMWLQHRQLTNRQFCSAIS